MVRLGELFLSFSFLEVAKWIAFSLFDYRLLLSTGVSCPFNSVTAKILEWFRESWLFSITSLGKALLIE